MDASERATDPEVARDIASDLSGKVSDLSARLRNSNHHRFSGPLGRLSVTLGEFEAVEPGGLIAHAMALRPLVDYAESEAGRNEMPPGLRAMVADVALTLGDLVALYPDERRRDLEFAPDATPPGLS